MGKISNTIDWEGRKVTYTWILDYDLRKYKPITQVYGICFDERGDILVIKDKKWQIPGGTPEAGETPEETLRRELAEEAQVEAEDIMPLGVQEVNFPGNPNKNEGELYYQCRFIAKVKKVNPPAADPATGRVYERKFVALDEIGEYIKWGEAGAEMFCDAARAYNNSKLC